MPKFVVVCPDRSPSEDGWLGGEEKKNKTDRNKVRDEIDAMLDDFEKEDPPDWDEIEELMASSPEPERSWLK